jgi:hypothetical protein
MARYDYSLTDEAKEFADAMAKANTDLWNKVQTAAEVITKAGDLNYVEMSMQQKRILL